MVFWALEQRRKWREELRAQGRAEGQAVERERLVRLAQEKGIDIAELLPKDEDRQ